MRMGCGISPWRRWRARWTRARDITRRNFSIATVGEALRGGDLERFARGERGVDHDEWEFELLVDAVSEIPARAPRGDGAGIGFKGGADALNAAMETHLKTSDLLPPPLGAEILDDDTLKAREEAVTDMLASHARRVAAIGGLVRELTADLDSARELWELQLDGDRNRTVQMNFRASIVAMSAAIAAVPASLGGMNVPHGLEEAPIELFWSLAGGIICGSTAIWYAYMRRFQRAGEITNRRASELASMQYILSHMDSLDNAFDGRALGGFGWHRVTREALRDAMRANASEAEPNGPTEDEVYDMLFSIYDTDRSQGIDVKEWRRSDRDHRRRAGRCSAYTRARDACFEG